MEDVFGTDPDPHEAVFEDDPGQQEDEGLVAAEECRGVGGVDLPQGLQVQVVGEDPQQTERRHLGEEHLGRQPVVPEEPAALPAHKDVKAWVPDLQLQTGCLIFAEAFCGPPDIFLFFLPFPTETPAVPVRYCRRTTGWEQSMYTSHTEREEDEVGISIGHIYAESLKPRVIFMAQAR